MTSPPPLILYTREDCHLCELAARMLQQAGLAWREMDVDADPQLEARYGLRVPVIRRQDTGEELSYPFNERALARLVAEPRGQ